MRRTGFLCRVGAALALLAILTPYAARAASSPAKLYPDFAGRKSGLGSIALLADLVVVEDVVGDTKKVYREDCRSLGRGLLDLMTRHLEIKGYSFSSRKLVSIGNVMTHQAQYRVFDRWAQHTEDATGFPIQPPPFYQDTTLAASDADRTAWRELLNGVWAYQRKNNAPAESLGSIMGLRDAIGADYALVVVVVGTKVPFGQTLMPKMPSLGGGMPRDGFVADVDIFKYDGTGIKLAVLDCRSGEVLWSDSQHFSWRASLNDDNLPLLCKNVIKRMI